MKKTMTEQTRQPSWLSAITEAAKVQQLQFPSFDRYGMGALRSASTASGRFVTLKRRFVPAGQAEIDGVEWALWREQDDLPLPVAGFREPLHPTEDSLATVLLILKGWLVDEWPTDAAKAAVAKHPRARVISEARPPCDEKKEYWLSDDRAFGIVIANDGWALSSRGKSLTSWRGRNNGAGGEHLPLDSLDRLCSWLAKQWSVVAYGSDCRPAALRGLGVAASRAYENAALARATEKDKEVPAWWSRHAVRAADGELPNVFLERQADEIVVSWDAAPASTRFYTLAEGEPTYTISHIGAMW